MKQFVCSLFAVLSVGSALAQGTAFTYQGQLNDGTNQAIGSYDLQFAIFDSATGGNPIAGPLTNPATGITNGFFTVSLDFGGDVFTGAGRWLEISVRTNGASGFSTLRPRQPMTPSPYSITAGSVVGGGISAGTYGSPVAFNNGSNQFTGAFLGNGGALTNVAGSFATPEMFGAVGGSHDDSAALAAMLASGRPIHTSNTCYTATNLIIPENTFWTASGTVVTQAIGAASFLLDASAATNFYIEGLHIDGGNYSSPFNRPLGTRSGLVINQLAGGAQIINCNASGFDQYGFFVTGTNTGSGGHELPLAELVGCRAWNNGIGLMLLSGDTNRGEYIDVIGLQSMTNTIGVEPDAGNVTFTGGKICDNQVGVRMVSGIPNGYHGVFSGTLINHSFNGAVNITGATVGELFDGCCFLGGAGNSICLTNCTGIVFNDCYFDINTPLISVGGTHGYNLVENCIYAEQWAGIQIDNLDGRLLFFNNNSRDAFGDASPNSLFGLGTYSTNFNVTLSPAGYTNYTGNNQVLNIQGTAGLYAFYMRSGPGGTNAASVPLWTNSVVQNGSVVYLGANCGVQVLSGSGIQLQVSDQ